METSKPGRLPAFSPTRLGTFLDCRTKYKYIYVDRIGRFYQKPHAYFSFGSTLHQVLQAYHGPAGTHTLEFLFHTLNSRWITAGYESADEETEYRELAASVLRLYHENTINRTDLVETDAVECNLSLNLGKFKLTGRIDRIDRHPDGSIEVVDYKSGRDTVTPDDVLNSLAMRCYMLLASRTMLATGVTGTIVALRTGTSASASMTPSQLEAAADEISALGNDILETDITLAEPVRIQLCEKCEFILRCERAWRSSSKSRGIPAEPGER